MTVISLDQDSVTQETNPNPNPEEAHPAFDVSKGLGIAHCGYGDIRQGFKWALERGMTAILRLLFMDRLRWRYQLVPYV